MGERVSALGFFVTSRWWRTTSGILDRKLDLADRRSRRLI